MTTSANFISGLTDELSPVGSLVKRFSESTQLVGSTSLCLSHRPAMAPEAYALRLYFPLPKTLIEGYLARTHLQVPPTYREVLTRLNGAHLFQLSLFGIPASMAKDPPMVDRSEPQPFDLETANRHWIGEYRDTSSLFHVGSAILADDRLVGYFLSEAGQIVSRLKSGEQIGSWPTISEFLQQELARAEEAFPSHEAFIVALRRSAD